VVATDMHCKGAVNRSTKANTQHAIISTNNGNCNHRIRP